MLKLSRNLQRRRREKSFVVFVLLGVSWVFFVVVVWIFVGVFLLFVLIQRSEKQKTKEASFPSTCTDS